MNTLIDACSKSHRSFYLLYETLPAKIKTLRLQACPEHPYLQGIERLEGKARIIAMISFSNQLSLSVVVVLEVAHIASKLSIIFWWHSLHHLSISYGKHQKSLLLLICGIHRFCPFMNTDSRIRSKGNFFFPFHAKKNVPETWGWDLRKFAREGSNYSFKIEDIIIVCNPTSTSYYKQRSYLSQRKGLASWNYCTTVEVKSKDSFV